MTFLARLRRRRALVREAAALEDEAQAVAMRAEAFAEEPPGTILFGTVRVDGPDGPRLWSLGHAQHYMALEQAARQKREEAGRL
jgi:hypothetical protein